MSGCVQMAARKFYKEHPADVKRRIADGVSRRAAARRQSHETLAAAVDLLSVRLDDILVGPRAERMAARMFRKIQRSRKSLTKNQVVGQCSAFSTPHPARVFDALVMRGDIVITDDGHCVIGERR
jgi:hypothetical protein